MDNNKTIQNFIKDLIDFINLCWNYNIPTATQTDYFLFGIILGVLINISNIVIVSVNLHIPYFLKILMILLSTLAWCFICAIIFYKAIVSEKYTRKTLRDYQRKLLSISREINLLRTINKHEDVRRKHMRNKKPNEK